MFGDITPIDAAGYLPIIEIILYPSEVLGIEEETVFTEVAECSQFLNQYIADYSSGPPEVATLLITFIDHTTMEVIVDLDNDLFGEEVARNQILEFLIANEFLEICKENLLNSKQVFTYDFARAMLERLSKHPRTQNYGKPVTGPRMQRMISTITEALYSIHGEDIAIKSIDNNHVEFHSGYRIEIGKIANGAINGRYAYPRFLANGIVAGINPESKMIFLNDARGERLVFSILDIEHPPSTWDEGVAESNDDLLVRYLKDLFSQEIVVEEDEYLMNSMYHEDYDPELAYPVYNSKNSLIKNILLKRVEYDKNGKLVGLDLGGYGIISFLLPEYPIPLLDLQNFSIEGYFSSLPKNMFLNCEKLKHLNIISNVSLWISPELFSNCKDLTHLTIRSKEVMILRENIFAHLPELTMVGLDWSSMRDLENVSKCDKLRHVSLSLNHAFLNREDIEKIIDLFSHVTHLNIYFPSLPLAYFKGNGFSSNLQIEKKVLLDKLQTLHEDKFQNLTVQFAGYDDFGNAYLRQYKDRIRALQ